MLFENRKQISAADLMSKYGKLEDYHKIAKKPSFEIAKHRKKVDAVNGNRIKTPKSSMMRAHFMATDPLTRLKVEIRYADSSNPKIVGDRVIDNFEPRYVETKGAAFAFQNNIDLAVYLFLHSNNTLSPLRDKNSKLAGKYEFVDGKKRSEVKMDKINSLQKAMDHARDIADERVVILAKGLGIKGIDKKELSEVRVDLMEFAMNNSKVYLEKIETQLTFIEGRIINLIDKGVLKLTPVGGIRRWTWDSGSRQGEHLLDIQNQTQDAKHALKNFFFNDINTWNNILNSAHDDFSAKEKAERELKQVEEISYPVNNNPAHVEERTIGDALPAHLRTEPAGDVYELPADNTAAKELLNEFRAYENKQASWAMVNQLMTAIGDGQVTSVNIRHWVKENLNF